MLLRSHSFPLTCALHPYLSPMLADFASTRVSCLALLIGIGCLPTTGALSDTISLPFKQEFSGKEVPSGWTVDKSEGATATPSGGLLVFDAPADKHALVKHRLGLDHVAVTARIVDAATIYLVWNNGAFVGTGKVSPTPFARFHSIDHHGDKTFEADHTGCFGSAPHLMRIQLGTDCIRFQFSKVGPEQNWVTLRTIERTKEFAGPPELVVVGKNYDINPADKSLVHTDSVGRGQRGSVAMVEVAETPQSERTMTAEERRWLHSTKPDPIAALLTNAHRDPTYDDVAAFYPGMKYAREVVSVPGQQTDIGVDWLGRIDASPWEGPIAWFLFGDGAGTPFADEPAQATRQLLDGYIPIVTLKNRRGKIDYQLEVFGWSPDFSPTAPQDTYVRVSAWAGGNTEPLPKQIRLTGKEAKPVAWAPIPNASGVLTLCIRFRHPDPKTAVEISNENFEKFRSEAARTWRDRLARCTPFDVPDSRVNAAYRAWLAYSMLNADVVDGRLEVHDGAGFYDIVFGHSMSRHATELDHYGDPAYAAQMLATQIHFQQSSGLYTQECGLPDHGALVMAIATHYLLTKDADWLKRVKSPLVKACDWIVERRREAPAEGVCRGLIKFRPYNDYNDPVFNYMGNILCCQGLEQAALALREIGEESIAEKYGEEGAKFRRDILDSMDAATLVHDGVKMLPIEPDTHRLLKMSKYKGGEYYGLVAGDLLDSGFFPVADPRAQLYVDMLEKRGGLAAGVCEFQEGIDHAYSTGYLLDRLRNDETRKLILGFWTYLAYGMTRETYSPVEVTLYKSGDNHFTLPHTFSCTSQLRLLRYMLLREEGNDLILCQGVPTAWLEPGKQIAVRNAPTLFGPVSYQTDVPDSTRLNMHLVPPSRNAPKTITIHLRHPAGLKIIRAESEPHGAVEVEGEAIQLTGARESLDLHVTFGK